MTQVMTPSAPITQGQIGKFCDLLSAALRKSGLPSEPTQQILESQGGTLAEEFVASIRARVELISGLIVRHVKVDRTRTPQAALAATGRKQYITDTVVATMPHGEGEETEVVFFKVGRYLSDDQLEERCKLRGLKPADPYSQSAVNEADPAFADNYPNGTHWKDAEGNWCYSAFDRWDDERDVNVRRYGHGWEGRWWFAGLRK